MEMKKVFTVEDLMAAIANNAAKHTAEEYVEGKWALSSQFYDQVMEDGHIFNPYLHRRFVPSQFLRLMKYNNMDAHTAIERGYGFVYSIEWVKEEVRKLAFLQKADPIAFDERKVFLTIDNVKSIIDHYVCEAAKFINDEISIYRRVKVGKYSRIGRGDAENAIAELHQFSNKVRSVITYESMNELLQGHYVIGVKYDTVKSGVFVESFEKAGAYYTLKHLVMFEHLTLNGKSGADACAELTQYLHEPANVVYDALMNTITANNYKL